MKCKEWIYDQINTNVSQKSEQANHNTLARSDNWIVSIWFANTDKTSISIR